MFPSTRRPVAVVTLLLTVFPYIAGCTTIHRVPLGGQSNMRHIVGVTTRSGEQITFASPGGQVTDDTLYGIGQTGQVILPTDSISTVWEPVRSTGRTVALVAVFAAAIGAVVAASTIQIGPFFGPP